MGSNPSKFTGSKKLPVEMVSWHDAQSLITKLKESVRLPAGWTFALPTEAQWEYACRAGSQGPWGNITKDQMGTLEELGWYSENSGINLHEVMTKAANAWGLHDMHGNVWEWCSDWKGAYSSETQTNPIGPTTGTDRVVRGGSWNNNPAYSRVAIRSSDSPSFGAQYRLLGSSRNASNASYADELRSESK